MVGNWGAVKGAGDGQSYEGLHRMVIKHSCLICCVWEGGEGGPKRSVSVWLGVSQLSSSTSTTITTDFRLKPFIPPQKNKQTPKCSLRADIKAIKK